LKVFYDKEGRVVLRLWGYTYLRQEDGLEVFSSPLRKGREFFSGDRFFDTEYEDYPFIEPKITLRIRIKEILQKCCIQ